MYNIFCLHTNMQSFSKIVMLVYCISFTPASHLIPIVLISLFSLNITFFRVCINSYTMIISCMPIITITVNAMNCWVDYSLIFDKLCFWWIRKTLSKRWHLEKLTAIMSQPYPWAHDQGKGLQGCRPKGIPGVKESVREWTFTLPRELPLWEFGVSLNSQIFKEWL
jgi:hypothetical protein